MIKSFNKFNENNSESESQNYMFFNNLATIKRLVDEHLKKFNEEVKKKED